MQTFDYKAYDRGGKAKTGSLTAESERQARQQLRELGLMPESLKPVTSATTARWFEPKISVADLALLMRQMATLVTSGLPLEESLRLISDQSDAPLQQRMVQAWRSELVQGYSFSQAIERSPFTVPANVLASIAVGEETGHLHEVLERLADDLEVGMDNRQTLIKALIYPLMMIIFAIMVVIVMMVVVVPQVVDVFASMRQELPLLTRIMIKSSNFVVAYGAAMGTVFVGSIVLFLVMLRDVQRKKQFHQWLLGVPKIGQWIVLANLSDWCRSLGMLLGSGVPALVALRISSSVVANLALRAQLDEAAEKVRQGSSLHAALKSQSLPGFMLHMIGSGEASSQLDTMLLKVSEYYAVRLRTTVDTLLKLLEPLLVVLMGGVVLLIIGSVMLPIVNMNQTIG